jgi:hypothetical protein
MTPDCFPRCGMDVPCTLGRQSSALPGRKMGCGGEHSPHCLSTWTVNPRGPQGKGSESQKTVNIIQRKNACGQKAAELWKWFSFQLCEAGGRWESPFYSRPLCPGCHLRWERPADEAVTNDTVMAVAATKVRSSLMPSIRHRAAAALVQFPSLWDPG